jgi:hypothetical protein
MWVPGFVLDEVSIVQHLAQTGNFPYQSLWAGDWVDMDQHPEEYFWRTLVADRGHLGQNPPTYYPPVCKESRSSELRQCVELGGYLDTKKLIS